MLKYFIELGREGNIYTKEVVGNREVEIQNSSWQADFWTIYAQEITDADGILYVSNKRTYLEKRHFKPSFKQCTIEEFIETYPHQTAVIRCLKADDCKAVWYRFDINKMIIYAAQNGDVLDKHPSKEQTF